MNSLNARKEEREGLLSGPGRRGRRDSHYVKRDVGGAVTRGAAGAGAAVNGDMGNDDDLPIVVTAGTLDRRLARECVRLLYESSPFGSSISPEELWGAHNRRRSGGGGGTSSSNPFGGEEGLGDGFSDYDYIQQPSERDGKKGTKRTGGLLQQAANKLRPGFPADPLAGLGTASPSTQAVGVPGTVALRDDNNKNPRQVEDRGRTGPYESGSTPRRFRSSSADASTPRFASRYHDNDEDDNLSISAASSDYEYDNDDDHGLDGVDRGHPDLEEVDRMRPSNTNSAGLRARGLAADDSRRFTSVQGPLEHFPTSSPWSTDDTGLQQAPANQLQQPPPALPPTRSAPRPSNTPSNPSRRSRGGTGDSNSTSASYVPEWNVVAPKAKRMPTNRFLDCECQWRQVCRLGAILKFLLFIGCVTAYIVCCFVFDLEQYFDKFEAEAVAAIDPAWWASVMIAVTTIANLVFLPSPLFAIVQGFLFFIWWGSLCVWIAKILSTAIAFWVGRLCLGSTRFARSHRLSIALLDRIVELRGSKILLFLRMSPMMPHCKLNYLLCLTDSVTFRDYMWTSCLGVIPSTAIFTWFGMMMRHVMEISGGESPFGEQYGQVQHDELLAGGIGAVILVLLLWSWFIGRALKRELLSTSLEIATQQSSVEISGHTSGGSYGVTSEASSQVKKASGPHSVASLPVELTPDRRKTRIHVSYGARSVTDEHRPGDPLGGTNWLS